jgi:hypothetical protein
MRQYKHIIALLLCVVASACQTQAQETVAETPDDIKFPSPDGRFGFLGTFNAVADRTAVDLVERQTRKALLRVEEENRYGWHILWSADSKRFAEMAKSGHFLQDITVYFASEDSFRKVKLPPLPGADIPARLKRHKHFPHIANLDYQSAVEWRKDGALVVNIETMIDGEEDGSVSATRTVVIGFNRTGKAAILKSTIKYATDPN